MHRHSPKSFFKGPLNGTHLPFCTKLITEICRACSNALVVHPLYVFVYAFLCNDRGGKNGVKFQGFCASKSANDHLI